MSPVDKTLLLAVVAAVVSAACGGPATPPPDRPSVADAPPGDSTKPPPDATSAPDAPTAGGTSGSGAADLVASKCVACHDSPAVGKLTKDELGAKLDVEHETVEITATERQAVVDYLAKP